MPSFQSQNECSECCTGRASRTAHTDSRVQQDPGEGQAHFLPEIPEAEWKKQMELWFAGHLTSDFEWWGPLRDGKQTRGAPWLPQPECASLGWWGQSSSSHSLADPLIGGHVLKSQEAERPEPAGQNPREGRTPESSGSSLLKDSTAPSAGMWTQGNSLKPGVWPVERLWGNHLLRAGNKAHVHQPQQEDWFVSIIDGALERILPQ